MTFEYLVQESIGDGKLKTHARKSGFATEADALAEGNVEAQRIALSASLTVWADVHQVDSEDDILKVEPHVAVRHVDGKGDVPS